MRISTLLLVALLFSPAWLAAAETGKISVVVNQIPAAATELVAVVDVVAPPAPAETDEPAAAIAAPPAAAKSDPAAPAPAAGQGRRRGGRRGANAASAFAFTPVRRAVATDGAMSLTIDVPVPAGENYQVRVVALRGGNSFPTVLAGGRVNGLKVAAEKTSPATVGLKSPALKLSADNPPTVAPGARYTLAGVVADAAGCLGTKNRMRVWMSVGAPPREDFAGAQVSTIDVKADGDNVTFSFALTAPADPTTLYFQIGELPNEFAPPDGSQAPFLVLPNLANGEPPLTLRVAGKL